MTAFCGPLVPLENMINAGSSGFTFSCSNVGNSGSWWVIWKRSSRTMQCLKAPLTIVCKECSQIKLVNDWPLCNPDLACSLYNELMRHTDTSPSQLVSMDRLVSRSVVQVPSLSFTISALRSSAMQTIFETNRAEFSTFRVKCKNTLSDLGLTSLVLNFFHNVIYFSLVCGTWWRLGWDDDFQPEGCGFDSRSSRHVGTLGKSFTCSCLCASAWNSDTQYPCCSRERLWVVEDLKGRYRNGRNEWMNGWNCYSSYTICTTEYNMGWHY